MRGGWSTLALVAVALGLGAYIYFVDSKRPDTAPAEKVFAVESDAVEEVRVTAKGETTVLKKNGTAWALTEPLATDADSNAVTGLVSSLTALDVVREVDPNATDLAQYGLATPKADITFSGKNGAAGRLRLGDASPSGTDLYAVKGDGARVILVGVSAETNLVKSAFELRDKRVLRFERDKADGLEITTAAGTVSLSRTNSEWRLGAPSGARGDYGAIEGLLTRLSTTMMSAIETTDVSTLPTYGLDKPTATVVVKAGSSTATLALGATADGKTFARDLARPMIFALDPAFATDVQKDATEYRRKEVFDLRAFSATKIVLTRGADTVTFQKKAGTGDAPADTWTVTGPGTTAARDASAGLMEEALTKLTGLRARSFDAAAPAGTTPVMTVNAEFEENKKEAASFGRAGADIVVVRPDEGGALRLDVTAVEDVLKAFDAVLAPPAPATPPAAPPAAAAPEKKP